MWGWNYSSKDQTKNNDAKINCITLHHNEWKKRWLFYEYPFNYFIHTKTGSSSVEHVKEILCIDLSAVPSDACSQQQFEGSTLAYWNNAVLYQMNRRCCCRSCSSEMVSGPLVQVSTARGHRALEVAICDSLKKACVSSVIQKTTTLVLARAMAASSDFIDASPGIRLKRHLMYTKYG